MGDTVYVFGGLEGKAMYDTDCILKLSDALGPVEDIGINHVNVVKSGLSINSCFNPAVTQLNHTEILVIGGQPNVYNKFYGDAFLFDVRTEEVKKVIDRPDYDKVVHSVARLHNDHAVLVYSDPKGKCHYVGEFLRQPTSCTLKRTAAFKTNKK